MKLIVVVQVAYFEWGKEARGGRLASQRTQAMHHLGNWLPQLKPETVVIVQRLRFNDSDAFKHPQESVYEYDSPVSSSPSELHLKLDGQMLRVMAHASHPAGKGKLIELAVGETARFEWNERIFTDETWRYGHTLINVGLCAQSVSRKIFDENPSRQESHLSQMY